MPCHAMPNDNDDDDDDDDDDAICTLRSASTPPSDVSPCLSYDCPGLSLTLTLILTLNLSLVHCPCPIPPRYPVAAAAPSIAPGLTAHTNRAHPPAACSAGSAPSSPSRPAYRVVAVAVRRSPAIRGGDVAGPQIPGCSCRTTGLAMTCQSSVGRADGASPDSPPISPAPSRCSTTRRC